MAALERQISTGSQTNEEEVLDPRIHIELEKLNKASYDINTSELELDEARSAFRQVLTDSTQKLQALSKKLGSCVEKARPYYEARKIAKEVQQETQKAALKYERSISMQNAAREMVDLAEQGYQAKGQPFDTAWQEMLNHGTMKVNEAETERLASEAEHQLTAQRFNDAEQKVKELQRYLRRAINKSRPYFEMKAKFNAFMEEQKQKVGILEKKVQDSKLLYSSALSELEHISDEIHHQRKESTIRRELGPRSAGVGAESPSPPPENSPRSVSDTSERRNSLSPRDSVDAARSGAAVRPTSFKMELSARSLADSAAAHRLSNTSPVPLTPTSPVQDFVMKSTSVFRRPKSAIVSTIDKSINSPVRRSVPADFLTSELPTLTEGESLRQSVTKIGQRDPKRLSYRKAVSLDDVLDIVDDDHARLPNTFSQKSVTRRASTPSTSTTLNPSSLLHDRERHSHSSNNKDYTQYSVDDLDYHMLPQTHVHERLSKGDGNVQNTVSDGNEQGSRDIKVSDISVEICNHDNNQRSVNHAVFNKRTNSNVSSNSIKSNGSYNLLRPAVSLEDVSSMSDTDSVSSGPVMDDAQLENLMLGDFEDEMESVLEQDWGNESTVTLREYTKLPERLSYLEPYLENIQSPVEELSINEHDESTCL